MSRSASNQPKPGETLAAYLHRARQETGTTQDQLVRSTGLPLSTIRKIEDGRTANPGVFTLLPILRALELPIDALMTVGGHIDKASGGRADP